MLEEFIIHILGQNIADVFFVISVIIIGIALLCGWAWLLVKIID